ncbi:hypothetical protein ACFL5V_07415 [Fibrobacterota bacterium]
MKIIKSLFLILALLSACGVGVSAQPEYEIHGRAWADVGRIMKVSDTLIAPPGELNLEGNLLHGMGAQFTIFSDLTDNIEGVFGFGAQKVSNALGSGGAAFMTINLFQSFLTESRITYYLGEKDSPGFSLTAGSFSHKYNPQVKNLGLYLLRGPVYPGILMGGFQDFYTDPSKGSLVGAHARHAMGAFSHDLLLNLERDVPPTFDWSLAYLAHYQVFEGLKLGAGVNFYRLVTFSEDLEEPGHLSNATLNFQKDKYIEVDTVSNDTLYFTHKGTKLMAYFNLDFKPLLGMDAENPNDLILYGETAIIGLKNYGNTYDKISERMPVMFGFNVPTFGLLDLLSLELEWYGCLYRNDLALVGNNNVVAPWTTQDHPIPSPKPVTYDDYGIDEQGNYISRDGDTVNVLGTPMDVENLTSDNLKWSLNLEKSVQKHIMFSAQVACDHYRPRPVATGLIFSNGGTATAFSDVSDWYFMFRTSFFF